MARVKICGITRPEDAELAADLGAWAIGFILWPGSKRRVDPAVAAGIARALRRQVELVGVFVNPTLDEVAPPAEGSGSRTCSCTATRARRSAPRSAAADRRAGDQGAAASARAPTSATPSASTPTCTCSTRPPGGRGGTGRTWDWALAAQRRSQVPLILSGGLTPENVAEGIAAVRPWAVDVASGVEAAPGIKDPAKVEAFIAAARGRGGRRRDARVEHRFGPYGGQYVPETLMPALAELEARVARRRATTRASGPSSARCCATSPAARRRSTTRSGSPRRPATRSSSSARTSCTPARTRSTTRSASACSPSAWARRGSSPRPAPASTASPPRPPARCSASSASSTWAPRTCAASSPTSSAWGCSARRVAPVDAGARTLKEAVSAAIRDWVANVGDDALRDRLVRRAGAVPGARARPAAGDRRRGARPDPRARGPAARPRGRLRRRRLERDRHVHPVRRATRTWSSSASRPPATGSTPAATARR